mgnify:CR=1 FL=1
MSRTVFITGANKGIGFATAKEMLKNNFKVIVGARDESRGKNAVNELSKFGEVFLQIIDVSDLKSIDASAENILKNFGDLEILVNNAGISGEFFKTAWEFSAQELIDVYMVNFIGAFEITKKLLPTLEKNHGRIINITMPVKAIKTFHPFAYQASKSPLNVLIDNFGFEIAQKNMSVEIIGIMPGIVSTDLNNHIQGENVFTPDESAKKIVEVILDKTNYNGQIIDIEKR